MMGLPHDADAAVVAAGEAEEEIDVGEETGTIATIQISEFSAPCLMQKFE